jgi:hypothetical protein
MRRVKQNVKYAIGIGLAAIFSLAILLAMGLVTLYLVALVRNMQ